MTVALPPQARAIIYWVYTGLAVLLEAVLLWFSVTEGIRPSWLDLSGEILLFLGVFFGFTAATNTQPVVDPTAFPPAARRIVYYIYVALAAIVGAVSIYFRVADVEPLWLDAANQILILLGVAFGFTAASHVAPEPPPADPAQPEGPAIRTV